MCFLPSAPKVPTMPERQAMQTPQDPVDARTSLNAMKRRGFFASIMTGPQGALGSPSVTTLGGG